MEFNGKFRNLLELLKIESWNLGVRKITKSSKMTTYFDMMSSEDRNRTYIVGNVYALSCLSLACSLLNIVRVYALFLLFVMYLVTFIRPR